MLFNFLISTQCRTYIHTWIPNNLPLKWESLLHISTLFLERKHFQTQVPHSQMTLTYTAIYTLKRDTLAWNIRREDFRYSDQIVLVWVYYHHKQLTLIPLAGIIEGANIGEIQQEWVKSLTHTREWHHLQPKTLRHWVCESYFLYVAQFSHFYTMWDLYSHLDT